MAKVMLVEDDPTMLNLLQVLLEIEGFQVAKISNPGRILDELSASRPDVILLDVNLKNANGMDVLTTVRGAHEFKTLPIIMSSGMELEEECRLNGANDFLLKPYMPDELITKIKRQLND